MYDHLVSIAIAYALVGSLCACVVDAMKLRARGRRLSAWRWLVFCLAWPVMSLLVVLIVVHRRVLRALRRRALVVNFETLPRALAVREGTCDPVLYTYDREGRLVRHEAGKLIRRLRSGEDHYA